MKNRPATAADVIAAFASIPIAVLLFVGIYLWLT